MKKFKSSVIRKGTAFITIFSLILLLASCNTNFTAVTMRVLRYEGSVSLVSDGKQSTLRENMLLHSGDTITTGQQSHIDLSLDDTKAVGLAENSIANFIQSGKKLKVNVREGEAYFYTTEKLEQDETFDLCTETLIVGIRGTSGYIIVDKQSQTTTFILTSGKVHIVGMNPSTGGRREAIIEAGQIINVNLLNDEEGSDSVVFYVDGFSAKELPLPLLSAIVANDKLLDEVSEQCGIPKEEFIDALNQYNDNENTDDSDTGVTNSTTTASPTTDATQVTEPNLSDNVSSEFDEPGGGDEPLVSDEPGGDEPGGDEPGGDDEPVSSDEPVESD